jgi:hypothetical protein
MVRQLTSRLGCGTVVVSGVVPGSAGKVIGSLNRATLPARGIHHPQSSDPIFCGGGM